MNKVGILGGTFDPVHNGHIFLAKTAMEKCGLSKVIFLPTGNPPHKNNMVASGEDRLNLLKKATANMDSFEVLDMEVRRPGITYTVDTLSRLKSLHPDWDIYYIIGTDTLFELDKWKDPKRVFELCTFVCMSRPVDDEAAQIKKAKELKTQYGKEVVVISIMGKDASSTSIRESGSLNLVPTCIAKDVQKIYVKEDSKIDRQALLDKIKPLISDERYKHCLSVEQTAIDLAKQYGADVEKASLAALLHDCAKNIAKDPETFAADHHIGQYLHDYDDLPTPVLHAPMGAHMAQIEFGVNDDEVLSAISWHTSGKPNMSLLDKVIYLADFTEPTRYATAALTAIREIIKTDLDMALFKALECSIEKIKSKGNQVHKNTLDAYNYMKKKMEEQNGKQ